MIRNVLTPVALTVLMLQPMPAGAQLLTPSAIAAAVAPDPQTPAPAPAFEYSDAYRTRAKIHRISSFAFLPLAGTQAVLGRKLFNGSAGSVKTAHKVVAFSIGGLFASNSITGVMNLVEARKDPRQKKLRLAHGLLMLASDAGFLTTALIAPDGTKPDFTGQKSTHRAVALTSIAMATTGYLLMLFGK